MILTVSDYENSALFHRHSVFERAKYASERENVSSRAGVEREAGASVSYTHLTLPTKRIV